MYCRDCSYDLRALSSHACPECGKAFDPANTSTWLALPRPGVATRALIAVTLVASLLSLPASTMFFAWLLVASAPLGGACGLFSGGFLALLLAPLARDLCAQDEWRPASNLAAAVFAWDVFCILLALGMRL